MNALNAARAAMLAEAQKPRIGWRRRALMLVVASLGTAGLVALVAGLAGKDLEWRVTLIPLLLSGLWLAFVSSRPGHGGLRWAGAGAAVLASLALVLTRDTGPESNPANEWLCTVLHVLAAVPAVATALWLLRSMAPSWVRALCAGLAAGVTGAVLGELMCGGDAAHVLHYHLTAWTGLTALVTLVSSRLSRTSWAP